jgi:alpha/beta superfamily hydrolase
VTSAQLRITSRDGLELEAELDEPEAPPAAVVVCHPHPQMGGTMDAPLLVALRDELFGRGYAVLRFNFRGIGRSQGEPSTGRAEVADAEGAVDAMRGRHGELPLALMGWSFGAAVAVRTCARDPEIAACVAIAPAVVPKPGVTDGLPDPAAIQLQQPLLVICAANDHLVDVDDAAAWVDREHPHVDVVVYDGGQERYKLLMSVE